MEENRLFTDSDFTWSIRMRPESPEDFFAPQDGSGELLEQKRQLLKNRPERYTATGGAGERLLLECWELAAKWGHLSDSTQTPEFCSLGGQWEADFILIDAESTALAGGCVCFPNQAFFRENWGLIRTDELNYHPKLNRPLLDSTIHENSVFLRIEHQAFVKLPIGILLGVRIEPVGFPELVQRSPVTAQNLLQVILRQLLD